MKRSAVLVISLCLLGAPALAKDVCVLQTGPVGLVFPKLKLPTKPGTTAPINGFTNPSSIPISGSIVREPGGEITIGLTLHQIGSTCFEVVTVDEPLTGTGTLECSPDFTDVPVTWTPIDCLAP